MNRLRAWWRKRRELAALYDDVESARTCVRAVVSAGVPPTSHVVVALIEDARQVYDKYLARKAAP